MLIFLPLRHQVPVTVASFGGIGALQFSPRIGKETEKINCRTYASWVPPSDFRISSTGSGLVPLYIYYTCIYRRFFSFCPLVVYIWTTLLKSLKF